LSGCVFVVSGVREVRLDLTLISHRLKPDPVHQRDCDFKWGRGRGRGFGMDGEHSLHCKKGPVGAELARGR
jgi:hypothetical protein